MILCCGEALIDMIPNETANGEAAFVPHSGGAVFNTAIALGRLGREVSLLSGVSTDLFGRQLEASLEKSGVGRKYLLRSARPTTLAFVTLENGHATYAFYDENTAGRMLAPDMLPAVDAQVTALFFGGISLACEPCAETYASLLAQAGPQRAVMIDPNIRPGFAPDVARYRDRLMSMLAQADIAKVSDEDLAWIKPNQDGLEAQAAALQADGPAIVLVTRGAEGATAILPGGVQVSVPARPTTVVDTVGAGDTFNAGVLAKLDALGVLTKSGLRSVTAETMQDALSYGAAAAAVTVSRAGANPPWANELGAAR
ncbi:carbohydrate kinase family protein [Tritonibacter horizontis]|uniref:2-dehydro-3-deoxygluconokinase n=1 Tax=Tritonibacter horizontis TaxID=1768241 RepID=A0A132BW65_9RHOB|nr:carbohydrate kinase [Tritonibacter horizontis]KUP92446.1 2-dehydro-3-deoxygluconokinase [Tritonibacter horizontis]